jgi:hypothetical protein
MCRKNPKIDARGSDGTQFVGSDEFNSYGTGYFCQDLFINGT